MLCTARDGLRYDDKVLITFNYKEGTDTITFGEAVKAEKSSKRNREVHQKKHPPPRYECARCPTKNPHFSREGFGFCVFFGKQNKSIASPKNDPLVYADLILNGDPEKYLKNVTGSHRLEI